MADPIASSLTTKRYNILQPRPRQKLTQVADFEQDRT
jgi:hypothetical protein